MVARNSAFTEPELLTLPFETFFRYWDTILEMSWPRFTYVVELNVDSVRSTDPQRLGVIDIRPHYVSA